MTGAGVGSAPLTGALAAGKDAIVRAWLARTLEAYPERTARFLAQEGDPFRNPVGQTLKEALPALFDELLGAMDAGRLSTLLDGIVRIRAVQDFTPSQATAFVFLLKKVIREQMDLPPHLSPLPLRGAGEGEGAMALAAVEGRIDEMALLAFDLFVRCREQMYWIKADEARRRTSLLERMRERP
ncbi:MAG: RsbRD N-terminal domain-containing protein [Candidatus Rokubacteria bacterium]|nr:RsbRD N-terminal domain-containing protein [Candidatus Rokubacteria bacterium]